MDNADYFFVDYERIILLEEKSLIENELIRMYEEYVVNRNMETPCVFMSYSSCDKSLVATVSLDLKERGISSWIDKFDILPGESIASKTEEGLEKCDLVLLFLSKAAIESNWVKTELESTLWDEINSAEVKIIPIKLEECEIPKLLRPRKYVNFSKDYSEGLNELVAAIKGHMNRKKTSK